MAIPFFFNKKQKITKQKGNQQFFAKKYASLSKFKSNLYLLSDDEEGKENIEFQYIANRVSFTENSACKHMKGFNQNDKWDHHRLIILLFRLLNHPR